MAKLSAVADKFITHWGEMGTRWGVNRSVAQIHALLFLSPRPLAAEEIAEMLEVARSNVSNSLKELLGWGVVRVVHQRGDRRDHFESLKDVWEMFQIILEERKRREIDPTIAILRECAAAAAAAGPTEQHAREKLAEMLNFFTAMTAWYQQIRALPRGAVLKIVKLGGKLPRLLGFSA